MCSKGGCIEMKSKWYSRKFWLVVTGILVTLANEGFGLNLPKSSIMTIAGIIIGYLIVEGAKDVAVAVKNGKAGE